MAATTGVLMVFGALAIWVGLLVYGLARRAFGPFLIFGLGLMLFLNGRYLVEGAVDGIAFFIGIYDVLINVGFAPDQTAAAVSKCAGNECTVWGERYVNHPAWGVAFYERFASGPEFRSTLLYGHIIANSLVFIILHIQMLRPGGSAGSHKLLGRISFAILTVGVVCAIWLASQHGPVAEYGGSWSAWGFYSMSAFVYGTAIFGIVAIRSGDAARHRVWMWRFAGSMWGSFWLFRVMLFVIDPILRDVQSAAILTCIWGSAPAGILIAELIRRRIDRGARSPASAVLAG